MKGSELSKKKKPIGWGDMPEKLPYEVGDAHTHIDMIQGMINDINETNRANECAEAENPSYAEIVSKASSVGIKYLNQSACELSEIRKISSIINEFENMTGSVAIHPNEAVLHKGIEDVGPDGLKADFKEIHKANNLESALSEVYNTAKNNPKITVIGETGIDLFRAGELGKVAQVESFTEHIKIARELEKPIQIHDREAHELVLKTLDSQKPAVASVLHSFSGDKEFAEECIKRGYYLSFSGTVTFKANESLREALRITPKELLLVETDAPFLTPHPFRGKPNSPYMIPYTVRYMAEVLDVELEALCRTLCKNHKTVFLAK
jgi:TatD DNase family protein